MELEKIIKDYMSVGTPQEWVNKLAQIIKGAGYHKDPQRFCYAPMKATEYCSCKYKWQPCGVIKVNKIRHPLCARCNKPFKIPIPTLEAPVSTPKPEATKYCLHNDRDRANFGGNKICQICSRPIIEKETN